MYVRMQRRKNQNSMVMTSCKCCFCEWLFDTLKMSIYMRHYSYKHILKCISTHFSLKKKHFNFSYDLLENIFMQKII